MSHAPQHHHSTRPRRWPEEWHVAISSSIAIAMIFGLIFFAAWMGSGDQPTSRTIPTAKAGK